MLECQIGHKRIVVCCDGTWQDGVVVEGRWKYTNVLKLSRAFKHLDERAAYAIPQVVFYQSGVGASPNFYSEYTQGATGASLVEKVQEAYAFISHNFHPGDEIFLFGFSRGAYTVRMVAMFIGAIGILNKTEVVHFDDIFVAYQKLGKSSDPAEVAHLQTKLAPWTSPTSPGKSRAISKDHPFSIKCVGVFDTVGSDGLPEETTRRSPSTKSIFGSPNSELGDHIERAYQALAINETRLDFNCNKFEQSESGRRKGQVLKQCWFSGEHSDIGGGWHDHDLSDLSLFWMVANIEDMLSMDLKYIKSLPNPVAPWGKQPPHNSRTGIFALAMENTRSLPVKEDEVTHETIHPSVLQQYNMSPQLRQRLQNTPSLTCCLLPFEEEMKRSWPFVPGKNAPTDSQDPVQIESVSGVQTTPLWSAIKEALSVRKVFGTESSLPVRNSDQASQDVDSSSPWGYEMKHAALHKAGQYDDAVNALEEMLSRMAKSPDPDVRERGDKYIHPSTTRVEIRKIVQWRIRHLPRVLIQTSTGRLCDKAQQASAFESLPIFNELVSSTTARIDYARIKHEVRQFFRYVMFSHKWEDNEPLFSKVIQTPVYDLEKSPTHDKLQMFCKIVRDSGFNWAWSDTCCINKSDHFILQEALVAMFKWYQNSVLVIVFLRGVHYWSELGALVNSVWNSRAWTLQEYIAAKSVHFYTEDWTFYLNLNFSNHKESPEVISEMEQATGVSAKQLMSLHPGLTNIREKLRLASTRHTTLVEDAAYSLLGIFSVKGLSAIYGEEETSLGRLLANVLTESGDVTVLAWTGESGPFNSCLPAHITVFGGPATSHLPSLIPEIDGVTASFSFDLDVALKLYDRLNNLSAAWFAASRMKLPCIAFELPSLAAFRTRSCRVYRAESSTFGMVKIKTRHVLTGMQPIYLIHPWLDALLGREEKTGGTVRENDPPPSPDMDDGELVGEEEEEEEIPEEEFDGSPLLSEPQPHSHPASMTRVDREMRARQFVVRLRQPFGALLLTLTSTGGRTDYKRVAADALVTVQFQENVSLADVLDNVRILDVL